MNKIRISQCLCVIFIVGAVALMIVSGFTNEWLWMFVGLFWLLDFFIALILLIVCLRLH